jgi:hypothetical protein
MDYYKAFGYDKNCYFCQIQEFSFEHEKYEIPCILHDGSEIDADKILFYVKDILKDSLSKENKEQCNCCGKYNT